MSESPYQPPSEESFAQAAPVAPGQDREHLRRIARYQRWIMIVMVAFIALYIVALAFRGQGGTPVQLGLFTAWLLNVSFGFVSIFLLAKEVFGTGLAVVCGILICFPCVQLITLLVINNKAVTILRQGGVKIGFFGVDPNSI
jgi:hypothetical protein